MTTRTQELYEKISDLMDIVDNLPDKDHAFIMNVADYEEAGRIFSEAQASWIEDLHHRYT